MPEYPRNIVVLGSTGSIGCSTLSVIRGSEGKLNALGLSAHNRLEMLCQQAVDLAPHWIAATDTDLAGRFDWSSLPATTRVLAGHDNLCDWLQRAEVDVVVAAIVGSAGLTSTWAAIEAGKTVALANKETLVVGGPLVMELARKHNATILPIDSEHSAVFQCLHAGQRKDVRRIILTASGGPFRELPVDRLRDVTVQQALAHPTWEMGPKVTIDSATMMNKALEIIEARWLFDLPSEQIDVVVHPQSIIHSMVEFQDGSLIAQLSPPDMRLPIQYALTYPDRWVGPAPSMDWRQSFQLELLPADPERFPALALGHEVAHAGGTSGAVLNAANEAAVAGFLAGRVAFADIVPACHAVLHNHHYDPNPTLDTLLQCDQWAREEAARWIRT